MTAELSLLVAAHLFGDFCLQNDWMQAKSRSSAVCTIHVLVYSIPFLILLGTLPFWFIPAVLLQHWFQDRFALHVKWMTFYKQSPPEKWPVGPLCIDQAWHIAFIALFWMIAIN